ncbi:hypothetical protein OAP32_00695 [Crocinitomicaceae bacterium]|nr:hypothetical protein [Crocinitomicaceae bacterium]
MNNQVTSSSPLPDRATQPQITSTVDQDMPENIDSAHMIANDLKQHEVDSTETLPAKSANKPKWANKPNVTDLQQAILQSAEMHDDHESRVEGWAAILNPPDFVKDNMNKSMVTSTQPFAPKHGPSTVSNKSKIQPKLARKLLEWRTTSLAEPLLAAKNLYQASPVTWEDTEAARQNQLILNNQFNHKMDRGRFTNEYVRRCAGSGTAIIYAAWVEEKQEVTRSVPKYEIKLADKSDKEMLTKLQALIEMEQQSPEDFYGQVPKQWRDVVTKTLSTGKPHVPHVTGYEETSSVEQVKNQPDYQFVNTKDIWVDPTCKGYVSKARYIVRRFYASIPDLKATGQYFDLDKVDKDGADSAPVEIDEGFGTATHNTEPNNLMADQLGKRVAVFEYWGLWDVNGDGLYKPVLASFIGNTIVRMEDNPYPGQFNPFVIVPYIPIIDSPFGEPDAELIGDNQRIIGATTRGMVDLMAKVVNGQTGMRQDALDPLNQQRFLLGKNYFFNPAMGDPSTNVFVHKFPEIPMSAPNMIASQQAEAEEMVGVRPFGGPTNVKNNTKGQNQNKTPLDAGAKRETDILRRLVAGLEELGRMTMAMNREFLNDKEVVRITNEQFVAIRREQLYGEVDISIEVVTPEEKAARASELAFMLQTMGPSASQEERNLVMSEIAELRSMPTLAEKFRNQKSEPSEQEKQEMQQAQEKHQLEVALLNAKIEVEYSRSGNLQSDSQLDVAKVGTEEAKARALNASSDLSDQEFVSNDGSNDRFAHENALQQAQSEGNIKLSKMKHQLEEQSKDNDMQREYAKNAIANLMKVN